MAKWQVDPIHESVDKSWIKSWQANICHYQGIEDRVYKSRHIVILV